MLAHPQLLVFGADHAPTTLLGSCGNSPGLACQLVWDVSHDGRAFLEITVTEYKPLGKVDDKFFVVE